MKRKTILSVLVVFVVALGLAATGCPGKGGACGAYEKSKAQSMLSFAKSLNNQGRLTAHGVKYLEEAERIFREAKAYEDQKNCPMAKDTYMKAWKKAEEACRHLQPANNKPPEDKPVSQLVEELQFLLLRCDSPMWDQAPEPAYVDHCVAKGESLWWIASYEDYYGDPFSWPLIYAENKCEIDWEAQRRGMSKAKGDGYAHWIFPGQVLRINMTPEIEDWIWARDLAGAPAPCDLPVDCGTASPYPWITCNTPEECAYYVHMLYDLGLISDDQWESALKLLKEVSEND